MYPLGSTWFTDLIADIVQWFEDIWQDISDWFTGLIEDVVQWFEDIWQDIAEWFEGIIEDVGEWLAGIWETVSGWVSELAANLSQWFSEIWSSIQEIFSGVATWFGEKFEAAKEAIKDAWSTVTTWFEEKKDAILDVFSDIKTKFKEVGKNIVAGIKQGILDAWTSFTSWVTGKIEGIVGTVKSALGISSPSKVFAEIGGYMTEGLGEGWNTGIDSVRQGIEEDMTFDTATVDFSASAIGGTQSATMTGNTVSVVQNIYSQAQTAADLLREARWEQERAVMRGV